MKLKISYKLVNGEFVKNEIINKKAKSNDLQSPVTPTIKKNKRGVANIALSIAPIPIMITAVGGGGIFWGAFMNYIFPYMLDIAKVFCAVKIAQGFYQEHRGGKEGGSGLQVVATYGRYYLIFLMIPWFVEVLDQIGGKMITDLRGQ